MTRIFIGFLFFCFTASIYAQSDTLNFVDSLGKRQGYWKITAAMKKDKSFYDQNAVCEEGRYVDNLKTGIWIEYYPNGVVRSRAPYVNGRPSGYCILYHENGHVSETGTWKNNHWMGEYRSYYETDTLQREMFFDSLGHRTGYARYCYPNGKTMIDCYYKNGKEDSIYREYYDDGNIKLEKFYVNGAIDPSRTKEYTAKPGAHSPPETERPEQWQFIPEPATSQRNPAQ